MLRLFRPHPLRVILVTGLLHGLLYVFLVPPWQHYDEPTHFEYAWLLAHRSGLPKPGDYDQAMRHAVATSMLEHNFFRGMNFLPDLNVQNEPIWIGISQTDGRPLYYLLDSLALRLTSSWAATRQLYAGRFVSLGLYLVSIVIAWELMKELVSPGNPLRWMVPVSMVLLPGYTDLMTAINSDVGATVLFSLFLWGSVRMIRQGFSLRRFLWVISAALLCYWTNNTVFIALPLLGLVMLFSLFRVRWRWIPWVVLITGIPIILVAVFSWGDPLLWIRSPDSLQAAPTRVLSAQAPFGKYAMQIEVPPGGPSSEIFQLLPEEQVKAMRGKPVTLGAWIWATQPLTINAFTLYDGRQSFSQAIQIDTMPAFFALSAVLDEDASHARVILAPGNPGSPEANTVFYDGLVLVEGAPPPDAIPQFDDPTTRQGTWGGQAFTNLLRNPSVEVPGPGIQPWPVENRPELLIYSSPELILGSLIDWRGAGWYYKETAQNLLESFWARFGWGHIPLSLPFTSQPYFLLAVFTMTGLGGAGMATWRWRSALSWNVLLFLGIALAGIWGQTILRGIHSLVYSNIFIPSARYAYPVIVPTLLVLNAGWLEVGRYLAHWIRLPTVAKYFLYFLPFLALDLAALSTIIHYYDTGNRTLTLAFFTQLTITTFSYAVLSFAFLGTGLFCSRILKIDFPFKHKIFPLIWLGWGITLLFLQVVNLVFPINAYISIPILIFGLIVATQHFKIDFWTKLIHRSPKIFTVLGVAVILWIASISMQQPSSYDSGLYHFNSIRWLNEFPIVLGLGNLHGRLAFNQSFFPFVAFLNVYPLFNFGHNLANSFLLLILLLECLFYLSKFITSLYRGANIEVVDIIAIFFVPVFIYLAQFGYPTISSPDPNITSSILQILIFIYFLSAIDRNVLNLRNDSQTMFVLIMSATAITIKLSNLFFALSICFMLLLFKLKSLSIPPKQIRLTGTKLIILPVFIILVWLLRGFLLSGCPAYPSTIGCVTARWSVPIQDVKSMADWIFSWARLPYQTPEKVLNSWEWLVPWFIRVILNNKINMLAIIYPLLIFIAIATAGYLLFPRHSIDQKAATTWLLMPFPILIGLFFWFYLAPDVRFSGSLFWILPISATVAVLKYLQASGKLKIWIILLLFFVMNINIGLIIGNLGDFIRISAIGNMPIPVAGLTEKTTVSGLEVLIPIEGDQCWDSKIPCAPFFNAALNFKDNVIFPEFTVTDARK